MKISSIEIRNFRCFQQYRIDFAPETTILIGKNGVGKSSLIAAMKRSLSFIFYQTSGNSISASSKYLKVGSFEFLDAYFGFNKYSQNDLFSATSVERQEDYCYPIGIESEAIFQDESLKWRLLKQTAGGNLQSTAYKDAFIKFIELQQRTNVLPVLIFFSDSYPHQSANLGSYASSILSSGNPFPRNFGYYQWDAETSCTEIWQKRFISTWKQRLNIDLSKELNESNPSLAEKRQIEKDELTAELQFVIQQIRTFSAPISIDGGNAEFEVVDVVVVERLEKSYLELHFTDGRKVLFDHLSAGYKRLYSIVLDIAYRSLILNGTRASSGIVMIDEIDLHLHPSLQQEVVQRLRNTFPTIQFIITTHSPLVVTNMEQGDDQNRVIKMLAQEGVLTNKIVFDAFGLSYDTSLEDIMETPARNSTVSTLIDSYIILESVGKTVQADRVKQRLIELVGNESRILSEIENRRSMNNE